MELLVGVAVLFLLAFVSEFKNFRHDFRCQQVLSEQFLIVVLIVGFFIGGEEVPGNAMRNEPIQFFLFVRGQRPIHDLC